MTLLLVLLTFALFLVIDHVYSKRRALQPALPADRTEPALPRLQPAIVVGFALPENLRYHQGHTWAVSESASLVRVGMDDFAAKLLGKVEGISLPRRGQWIRQGQKVLSVQRDGAQVEMVSPIEGSVTDINEAVVRDPELARRDPYGEGWLLTVQAPDAKTNFRNLLGGLLARWWLEESVVRLQRRLPSFTGLTAMADGGMAVDNVTGDLPRERWTEIAREFFLS